MIQGNRDDARERKMMHENGYDARGGRRRMQGEGMMQRECG